MRRKRKEWLQGAQACKEAYVLPGLREGGREEVAR